LKNIKRHLLLFLIIFLISGSINNQAQNIELKYNENNNYKTINNSNHLVFAELAATSWCPSCPTATAVLKDLYEEKNFAYVTLVSDLNPIAKKRVNQFYTIYIPTVYFDGGYLTKVGRDNALNDYKDMISESENRTIHSIEIVANTSMIDNTKIHLSINVKNNDNKFYFGKIRSYITEIESRWENQDDKKFQFALLDFALDTPLFITPSNDKQYDIIWDSEIEHDGQLFNDIDKDNIMIITTVSHGIPPLKIFPDDEYTQLFMAFYIDATVKNLLY